jgi:hypothetical protein
MRSPIVAVLWEIWRLTRFEAAWRLVVAVLAASAVLALSAAVASNGDVTRQPVKDFGAAVALILLVVPQILGWFSINKLNVARPGFPFYLLYTRPVRTTVAVGVSMAYLAAASAVLYLVSALSLRMMSGYAFPLLPVAAWIAALNLASTAAIWSIRNLVVRSLGSGTVAVAWTLLATHRFTAEDIPGPDLAPPHRWPTVFDFPLSDYASIAAIAVVSFALTVAAVARQRHGDGRTTIRWMPGTGFPDWLVNLFPFSCPTGPPTWAQVWFELKSRGLPLLAIGLAFAIVNPLVFAVSGPIDAAISDGLRPYVPCASNGCFYGRTFAVMFAMVSVVTVLALGGNAFGIRWRQGRVYVSAFEATQAYGTARLTRVKVLVMSLCQLIAIVGVGVSIWASLSLLRPGDGGEPFIKVADMPLSSWQRSMESALGALRVYEQLALAIVGSTAVAVSVALRAALGALWTRYPRRLNVAASLLLLAGSAPILLALVTHQWNVSHIVLAIVRTMSWVAAAGIGVATAYLAWRTLAERLLTLRQAWGAVLVSAGFGAAWLTLLRTAGVSLAGMPAVDAASMVSPALLPLTLSALVPWSLSRVRHT